MSLGECVVVALAVWQIIEIWHHGEVFDTQRAKLELWEASDCTLFWFVGRLSACAFCLSPWIGWICALIWQFGQTPGRILLTGFAVARLANVGNDLLGPWSNTPQHDDLVTSELESVFEHDRTSSYRDGRDSAELRSEGATTVTHGDPNGPGDGAGNS